MDAKLQELFNQNAAAGRVGHPVGVGSRPMKWGDSNNIGFGAFPNNTLEYCYVDIGPFPTPIPIRLDAQVIPKASSLPGIPARATCRMVYRLIYSIGEASQVIELPMLPRQLCVRSLQVYARRLSNASITNDSPMQNMGIWATPVSSNNAWPVPFDYEEVTMGIGTGAAPLAAPSRLATHVTGWALGGTNQRLFLQFTFTGGGSPAYRIGLYSIVSNDPKPFVPQPLPHDVETALGSYQLVRGSTTAAETVAVAWCR